MRCKQRTPDVTESTEARNQDYQDENQSGKHEEIGTEGLVPQNQEQSKSSPLMYKLVRLKPNLKQRQVHANRDRSSYKKKRRTRKPRDSLHNWFLWYLPAVALGLLLMYALAELLMKHLAFQTAQAQWRSMPEAVEDLPIAPVVTTNVPSVPRHTSPIPSSAKLPSAPPTKLAVAPRPVGATLPQMEFSAIPTEMAGSQRNGMLAPDQASFTWEFLEQPPQK